MKNIGINRTFLIFILGLLAALGPFTIDMYIPGFEKIAQDFNVTVKDVTYTLTSYFIGISIGQLIYGPLVDKYGRKKPLIVGLSLFILSALGCFMSTKIWMLIFFRFTQALGGCVGMVASNAIISDVYKKEDMAKAFSSIMLVMGVAPIIAPTLGGFIIEYQTWQMIFVYLTIAATLVALMIAKFLPETHTGSRDISLRVSDIAKTYWDVLRNRPFFFYSIISSLAMAILFSYISLSSEVFLHHYNLGEKVFGIIFGINAFGFITGNTINGQLLKWFKMKAITMYASVIQLCIIIVTLSIVWMYPSISYYWIVAGIFSSLFCLGLILPNVSAMSLSPFHNNRGFASALSGSVRMAFASVISGILGSITMSGLTLLFITFLIISVSCVGLLMYAMVYKKY